MLVVTNVYETPETCFACRKKKHTENEQEKSNENFCVSYALHRENIFIFQQIDSPRASFSQILKLKSCGDESAADETGKIENNKKSFKSDSNGRLVSGQILFMFLTAFFINSIE